MNKLKRENLLHMDIILALINLKFCEEDFMSQDLREVCYNAGDMNFTP